MKVFNAATEAVKRGVQPGRQYGILRLELPDIMEFITCQK
jgi:ribonucleoside-diphosphate reductase alpha chain